MASQAEISYTNVFVGGPLLSRRHITDENGTDLTAADVASVTLNVYRLALNSAGRQERIAVTGWEDIALTVGDVLFPTITASNGKKRNFSYCVEGAFTLPDTSYLVEYRIVTTSGHTIIILIQATTRI